MDDFEQNIKEKILKQLLDLCDDKMGSDLDQHFPKKAVEVSVAAPDKEHLQEGLEHAQDLASSGDIGGDEHDDDSDEARLMALLGDDDEEDEDKKSRF